MSSTRSTSTYSHNGCTRCKKMKIKCDEKQPTCGACERKKTTCVYEFPFVIYNPHLSKKKKKKNAKGGNAAKVTKDSSQSQPAYKLKAEDKRILQITLPSEFKFVAEKFDDETSSSSSAAVSTTTSPSTTESQINSKAAQISRKYELLKANQNIESSFAQKLSIGDGKQQRHPHTQPQQPQNQSQQHQRPVSSQQYQQPLPSQPQLPSQQYQQGHHHHHQQQHQHQIPSLPSQRGQQNNGQPQMLSPSAIPNTAIENNIHISLPVDTNAVTNVDQTLGTVKIEDLDNDIFASMLNTDDLFAETSVFDPTVPGNADPSAIVPLREQRLPEVTFNFYTSHNVGVMLDYFSKVQPIIDARHLTPEDPEVQDLIWRIFICGKALSNHLFVDDDFRNNDLIDWLKILSKTDAANHNIIFTSITAATTNGIYLQTNIYYWYVVKERYMDYTISILKEYIDSSNSFVLMTCLLFTVLLLYSERSGTDSPVWRFHLKGALGILKKINWTWDMKDIHAIEKKSVELEAAIKLFHFCECWFSAAESLAWVSSINGGSLPCETPQDVVDARQLLFGHLQYENENSLVNGGFNTIRFYPQSLVKVMNEVVLHTMSLRINYDIDLTELNGLLLSAPPTMESFYLGQRLLSVIQTHKNDKFEFATCNDRNLAETMRIAAKCYSIGIECYVLSNLMGYKILSPEIQQSVVDFISHFNKMPYLSQCAISIHWPCFFLACCTPAEGNLRDQILKPLNIMVGQTMLAATFSIKRIKQIWRVLDTKDFSNIERVDTICF